MPRARRAEDWERDLKTARAAELEFAGLLSSDPRLENLTDHTDDTDRLDYSFTHDGMTVWVDLKEKRQPYSLGIRELSPEVPALSLFIVDETVYRRIIWQGGGGYLVVHDHPGQRWVIFGPWELTLGPRVRYQRWGSRTGQRFLKGKVLLDLRAGARQSPHFSVDDLLWVIDKSRAERDTVEAVATRAQELPELG
ncbi:MAG: hypothetical protein ACRDKB_12025 [Actinomycetota bacterium]